MRTEPLVTESVLDASGFQRGSQQIVQNIRQMERAMNQAAKGQSAFDHVLTRRYHALNDLIGRIQFGMAGASAAVLAFGVAAVRASYNMQSLERRLTIAGKSAERAKELLDFAKVIEPGIPETLNEVVDAIARLEMMRIDPKKVMGGMADYAAAMGKPIAQVIEATYDALKDSSWRRMEEIGIQKPQVQAMIPDAFTNQGSLKPGQAYRVMGALGQIFTQRAKGAAAQMASTPLGQLSATATQIQETLKSIGDQIIPVVNELMQKFRQLLEWVQRIPQDWKRWGVNMAITVPILTAFVGGLAAIFRLAVDVKLIKMAASMDRVAQATERAAAALTRMNGASRGVGAAGGLASAAAGIGVSAIGPSSAFDPIQRMNTKAILSGAASPWTPAIGQAGLAAVGAAGIANQKLGVLNGLRDRATGLVKKLGLYSGQPGVLDASKVGRDPAGTLALQAGAKTEFAQAKMMAAAKEGQLNLLMREARGSAMREAMDARAAGAHKPGLWGSLKLGASERWGKMMNKLPGWMTNSKFSRVAGRWGGLAMLPVSMGLDWWHDKTAAGSTGGYLSGALSGAARWGGLGSVAGPWGTVIGGIAGAIAGLVGEFTRGAQAQEQKRQTSLLEQAQQNQENIEKNTDYLGALDPAEWGAEAMGAEGGKGGRKQTTLDLLTAAIFGAGNIKDIRRAGLSAWSMSLVGIAGGLQTGGPGQPLILKTELKLDGKAIDEISNRVFIKLEKALR